MSLCVSTLIICKSSLSAFQTSERKSSDNVQFVSAKTLYGDAVELRTHAYSSHSDYLKMLRIQTQLTSGSYKPKNNCP